MLGFIALQVVDPVTGAAALRMWWSDVRIDRPVRDEVRRRALCLDRLLSATRHMQHRRTYPWTYARSRK
jgi:hypothetical protein